MIQYLYDVSDIFLEVRLHHLEYWALVRDAISLVITSVHQKHPLVSVGQTIPNSLIAGYTVVSDVKGKDIEHTPGYLAQGNSLTSSFWYAIHKRLFIPFRFD
jgi:hypothetical protein